MKTWAVIVAAGKSTRMGGEKNKVFLPFSGEALLCHTVRAFQELTDGIVVVTRPEERAEAAALLKKAALPAPLFADGGETRQQSVLNGLLTVPEKECVVLVHDGARANVSHMVIKNVIDSVLAHRSGIASVPVVDTIDQTDGNGWLTGILNRETLRACQTPQGFYLSELKDMVQTACSQGRFYTDESSLAFAEGKEVYLTEGDVANVKVTYPQDLKTEAPACPFRVGHGYDVHQLVEGRKLILCGEDIPNETGLLGHSDADVAVHALMDALLGAAGLGDIGRHFPDTQEQYKGISSLLLLEKVMALIRENGWYLGNADVTIVAQRPKLAPYMQKMQENLARVMKVEPEQVHLKATTTEKLGFEGRQEGISAQAVCLLYRA